MFYENFYRSYGIRNAAQFSSPTKIPLAKLELPVKSILHYIGHDAADQGPEANEYLFRKVSKPIPMLHITKLLEGRGGPRYQSVPIQRQIQKYHAQHKRYRLNRDISIATRDATAPCVVNYCALLPLYKYQRTLLAEYNRWYNIHATVWKTVAQICQESDRQQFLIIRVPERIPGLTDFRIAAESIQEGASVYHVTPELSMAMEALIEPVVAATPALALEAMNQRTMRAFQGPDAYMLLELWKWMGPQRQKSLLNVVPEEHLSRVNIIIQEAGFWTVFNLGKINQWRQTFKDEKETVKTIIAQGINAIQFQNRFLHMVIAFIKLRTQVNPEVAEVDDAVMQEQEEEAAQQAEGKLPTPLLTKPTSPSVAVTSAAAPKPAAVIAAQVIDQVSGKKVQLDPIEVPQAQIDTSLAAPVDMKVDDQEIEKNLKELDRISQMQLATPQEKTAEVLADTGHLSLEDAVLAHANRLAESGMMTPAELRRYTQLSQQYKSIVAPDGKRTLAEFIQIEPEETALKESPSIPDIATVTDKTMLKSSLHDFDSRYLKEIFHRDVAGMVANIQRAGLCVTEYDVERIESITGAYDAYTVKVVPVEGTTSTLHFRLPVIEPDGTYLANGVKYYLRKQRGSLPIHKVAPDRVALTSYYGKTFITRSNRKTNDYGEALRRAIMEMGLDAENQDILNLHPMDVFDREFECPRLYSILAKGFASFSCGGWDFLFDHLKREAFFGADALALEGKGTRTPGVLVAQNAQGQYLLVDYSNTLWKITRQQVEGKMQDVRERVGSIEAVIPFTQPITAIDISEIKVLGKTIPLGIVLAYELGLTGLCQLLKVTPRIVPAGNRVNREDHEYAIIFEDETWLFDRRDTRASLLLAGFREYHQALRDYGSHLFDQKAVYLNILESQGLSARWIKEIDLMYQLFLDPITKEILAEMGEPTTFRGLLLRANELLMVDQHPDEFDPRYLRTKGYERMAGAVYTQLVDSIRKHQGKPARSRHPIELKPFAVWEAIQTDPAKGLVKDINPIQNLKEKEAMTFSGSGGRSGRSMVKRTRKYHSTDMGVTSESTVDSGDVGINTYTSADPQFTTLRGRAKPYEIGKTGATALLSTSALLAPGSDRDD